MGAIFHLQYVKSLDSVCWKILRLAIGQDILRMNERMKALSFQGLLLFQIPRQRTQIVLDTSYLAG